jgi:SAM-dependent methyltransferase
MKNYLSPLKFKDYLILIGLIIIGFGWLLIDQIFLPQVYQRVIAFFILMFILYYLQFAINKPVNVMHYANSITTITVSFIVIVSLIMHVVVNNDFTYKSILIWIITGLLPYISGFLYINKKKLIMEESKCIELNEAKWDGWVDSLDKKGPRSYYLRRGQRDVISLLNIKENMSILDIGCGTGWALGQAANLIHNKGSFYGVDLSAKMIERANENFKTNENFHFIKANAESIPLDDNLFDFIICTNSFHHYSDPDKALKEMYRLLKIGGRVYILDPTGDIWIVKFVDKLAILLGHGHVKFYNTKEFKKLIVAAGFLYEGHKTLRISQKIHIGEK